MTQQDEDKNQCEWDEEALKYVTRSNLSSATASSSEPSIGSASVSSGSFSSSNGEFTSTGSWDGNDWYRKLSLMESPTPMIEFNATFAGQTAHERSTSSTWLDPNNVNRNYHHMKRKTSRLNEDTRVFYNLPDIEVSYQSDSGSGSEIDLVELDEGRSRSQVFSNINSFVYD